MRMPAALDRVPASSADDGADTPVPAQGVLVVNLGTPDACARSLANLERLPNANGATPPAVIRDRMLRHMQAATAVFRTGATPAEGVAQTAQTRAHLAPVTVP